MKFQNCDVNGVKFDQICGMRVFQFMTLSKFWTLCPTLPPPPSLESISDNLQFAFIIQLEAI